MIANDVFTGCFGIAAPGDTDAMVKIVVGAVRDGFAVVLDRPGQKVPLCTLTRPQSKAADLEAQQAAKDAGDRYWERRRHPCGLHHALTDPKDAARIVPRMIRNAGRINIGVELGRSRMVVVDVDTAAEKAAFLAAWSAATGTDRSALPPTVLSPGSAVTGPDGTRTWVHKDGGHYWFTLPDGYQLPDTTGVLKGEGGWAVLWHGKQVLVPPSVREEGAYTLVGQPSVLPLWLRDFITAGAAAHDRARSRTVERAQREGGPIDAWAAQAPWADLLDPDGWTDTGKADTCGCPVWTAPGDHASPKSATAHDAGCDVYDTGQGHAPLHVWTDNPPEWVEAAVRDKGSRSVTKLTYLAYRLYDGSTAGAISALGLGSRAHEPDWDDPAPSAAASSDDDDEDGSEEDGFPGAVPAAAPSGQSATLLPPELWDARPELAHIRQAAHSRSMPADAVLHGVLARLSALLPGTARVDTGILSPASLNYFAALVAPSGIGKSSSSHLAAELLAVPEALRSGGRFLDRLPIGSGEGLAEAFMGTREEPTGEQYASGPRRGEDKMRTVRGQVRSNVLFYVDEGKRLTTLMAERSGSTLGEKLRTAWTGDTLGDANGTAERTRIVRGYALGMVVGFQPVTAVPMLDGVDEGTPQRFVWSRINGRGMPAAAPDWPGPLELDPAVLGADPFDDDAGSLLLLTMEWSLREEIRAAHMSKLREECEDCDGYNSHRPLTLVKIAALLALLASRTEVTREDWDLAALVWNASTAVRDALLALRERERSAQAEAKKAVLVDQARAVQEATGGMDPVIDRVARWLARKVRTEGVWTSGELRRSMAGRDRQWFKDAAEYALSQEWIAASEDGTAVPGVSEP